MAPNLDAVSLAVSAEWIKTATAPRRRLCEQARGAPLTFALGEANLTLEAKEMSAVVAVFWGGKGVEVVALEERVGKLCKVWWRESRPRSMSRDVSVSRVGLSSTPTKPFQRALSSLYHPTLDETLNFTRHPAMQGQAR